MLILLSQHESDEVWRSKVETMLTDSVKRDRYTKINQYYWMTRPLYFPRSATEPDPSVAEEKKTTTKKIRFNHPSTLSSNKAETLFQMFSQWKLVVVFWSDIHFLIKVFHYILYSVINILWRWNIIRKTGNSKYDRLACNT